MPKRKPFSGVFQTSAESRRFGPISDHLRHNSSGSELTGQVLTGSDIGIEVTGKTWSARKFAQKSSWLLARASVAVKIRSVPFGRPPVRGKGILPPNQVRSDTAEPLAVCTQRTSGKAEEGFHERPICEHGGTVVADHGGADSSRRCELPATNRGRGSRANGAGRIEPSSRKATRRVDADGQMTDEMLEDLSGIEHITVARARRVSGRDRHWRGSLARLSRLRHLDLSGTGVTESRLESLRCLSWRRFPWPGRA